MGILRGYLERAIGQGKRAFTIKEKRTLLKILRQRGGRSNECWDQEIKGHYKTLTNRRDMAFRLTRLSILELRPEDSDKVESLLVSNTRWHSGRMKSLSVKQRNLVLALEAEYLEQRVATAEALANALSRALG